MAKTAASRPQPVITSYKPVVTCAVCLKPLVHDPAKGAAAEVLTKHYNSDHTAEELAALS